MFFIYYLAFGAAFYTWLFWRVGHERGGITPRMDRDGKQVCK